MTELIGATVKMPDGIAAPEVSLESPISVESIIFLELNQFGD
ncbi:hypothetical protein Ctob_013044, partial [Chrysochromulina tobinii]